MCKKVLTAAAEPNIVAAIGFLPQQSGHEVRLALCGEQTLVS